MEQNFSSIKQRILQHIDFQRISKREFYKITGMANGLLDKKTGLTEDNIEKYISSYPEINHSWLLTGQGSMFRYQNPFQLNETQTLELEKEILLVDFEKVVKMLEQKAFDLRGDSSSFRSFLIDFFERTSYSYQTKSLMLSGLKYLETKSNWNHFFLSDFVLNSSKERENATPRTDKDYILNVPLVHQYAYAGYLSGFGDPEYLEELPIIPFPVDSLPKGNYLAFEVKGDSMDNGLLESYPNRSQVLAREVQKHHWQNKLHINQWKAFVIVHRTEGILLKRIINHNTETGILTLHSLNDMYEDFEVSLDDCVQLFNVVKRILD